MVRFVMLTTFTEVGASQIQDTTRRAQMVSERAAAMGVTVETLLWTLGEIDAVVIVSAPDEGSVVALSTFLAKQGYIRTRLLRAFTEAEFATILGRMPGGTITLDAD
jgi:uncharacterized protein with GYD domain